MKKLLLCTIAAFSLATTVTAGSWRTSKWTPKSWKSIGGQCQILDKPKQSYSASMGFIPPSRFGNFDEAAMFELEAEWEFVNSPSLSVYLERMAAQVCRRMNPAPRRSHVVLFDAPEWWTLALPSGTILLSLGTLEGLEDEAELAFILAHELAHAASAEAAVRLVRTGLQVVALEDNGGHQQSWSHAAHDLIRLGYGRVREREADRRAIEVVTALGYDPNSVAQYLRRLNRLIAQGDRRVAEIALAHPTPAVRARTVEEHVSGSAQPRIASRVNREVFRRVAGHNVLATRLERVEGFGDDSDDEAQGRNAAENAHRRFWLAVAVVALATALGIVAWQFL